MNKFDLIVALAKKENLMEINSIKVVNMIFDGFTEMLRNGGRIEIRGFGSFSVREYGAYTGRNPKTGQNIKVEPKRLPCFRVGRELKKRVDG